MTDYEESATECEFIYRLASYLATYIKVETGLSHLGQRGSGSSRFDPVYRISGSDPVLH